MPDPVPSVHSLGDLGHVSDHNLIRQVLVDYEASLGVANGIATLNGSGLVPTTQLPPINDVLFTGISGPLVVTTGALRFPIMVAGTTILGARAMVGTAPTGSSIIVDVLKNGTTIYTGGTGRPTIAVSTNDSGAPTTPAITAATTGDYLTVNISQVGSTIAGSDLVVSILVAY